jgi:hypothetical protein
MLNLQMASSSSSYWVVRGGYMVVVPTQVLSSFVRNSSDLNSALAADQELTQYATQRLMTAGYRADTANSATSTNSAPFYVQRLAFASSNGMSQCVIEPPDPTQAQLQVSWSFYCAATQDVNNAFQNEEPFLQALGDPKGAALSVMSAGTFASVEVSGEVLGYYNAIMIESAGKWKVVYQGQGAPPCSLMQHNSIPQSIYGQCS